MYLKPHHDVNYRFFKLKICWKNNFSCAVEILEFLLLWIDEFILCCGSLTAEGYKRQINVAIRNGDLNKAQREGFSLPLHDYPNNLKPQD